jgi:hypothetical protein
MATMVGEIRSNSNNVDSTAKLISGLVDVSVGKDADYIEVSSGNIKISIGGHLIKLKKLTTPAINQEIISYLLDISKIKFRNDSINSANIKLKGKRMIHKLNLKFIKDRFGLISVLIFVDDPISVTNLANLGFWGRNLNQLTDVAFSSGGMALICGQSKMVDKTVYSIAALSSINSDKIISISVNPNSVPELEGLDVYGHPKTDFASLNLAKLVTRIRPKILIVEDWLDNPNIVNLMIKLSLGGTVVIAKSENLNPEAVVYELYRNFSGSKRLVADALSLVVGLKAIPCLNGGGESFTPSDANLRKIEGIFKLSSSDVWSDLATIGNLSFTDKPLFWANKSAANDGSTTPISAAPSLTTINQCLVVDSSLRRFIEAGDLGRGHLISRAVSRGMMAMHYDGLIKAMRGDIALSDLIELIKPNR